jgi:hypothetical protein
MNEEDSIVIKHLVDLLEANNGLKLANLPLTERDGKPLYVFQRQIDGKKYPLNDIIDDWRANFHGLLSGAQGEWKTVQDVKTYCAKAFVPIKDYPMIETLWKNALNTEFKSRDACLHYFQSLFHFLVTFLNMASALQQLDISNFMKNTLWKER